MLSLRCSKNIVSAGVPTHRAVYSERCIGYKLLIIVRLFWMHVLDTLFGFAGVVIWYGRGSDSLVGQRSRKNQQKRYGEEYQVAEIWGHSSYTHGMERHINIAVPRR